jgi:hypothetical protein
MTANDTSELLRTREARRTEREQGKQRDHHARRPGR